MAEDRPQYFPNNLQLPHINQTTLLEALKELRTAVINGVDVLETADPPSGQYDGRGLFNGELGIALAYLRLAQQASSLAEGSGVESLPEFHALAGARIPNHGPNLPLQLGRLSPLSSHSPLSAVLLRILLVNRGDTFSETDVNDLTDAVTLALSHGPLAFYHGRNMGADEILYGRTGLLWALLNIRSRISDFPLTQKEALTPILELIPELLQVIISAGRQGAREYQTTGGEHALSLMWPWMEGYYGLGVAHGLTGIIPVLLSCHPEEIRPYLPEIGETITGLCRVCMAHDGHLPTSIPPRSSHRTSPLVQICHGSPAILALLGCAMKGTDLVLDHWEPEWNQAAGLASERVWEQGLLSKGGGLCHGITGNAWPFLLLHDVFEYNGDVLRKAKDNYIGRSEAATQAPDLALTGDHFLSKALAMLLHARETRPYNQSPEAAFDYRVPDHPYSLFEGLAGTVCAWAEACAVIRARLRKMQLDERNASLKNDPVFRECVQQQLGFPCVGGSGSNGVL